MAWRPWARAWQDALYGEGGFYRQGPGPTAHFVTAAQGAPQVGAVLARALTTWMAAEDLDTFVDWGAGRGELLEHVHRTAPALRCVGVDVVDRPALAEEIEWMRSPGGGDVAGGVAGLGDALVVANEWLDVVPCTVAEVDAAGVLREVLVDTTTGRERLGDPLSGPDLGWARRSWRHSERSAGDRVEVGSTRDDAWAALVDSLDSGVAVAIDYGHLAAQRPRTGTLTGFRHGRQVPPVPDGACDLTAHVAMDTLTHDELVDQRTALRRLGVTAGTPEHALAGRDPTAYLHRLATASAEAALTARGGFGDFLWSVSTVPGTG